MATDREHPDGREDADIALLLESAFDAPQVRGEFISVLRRRLDAEFASLHRRGSFVAAIVRSVRMSSACANSETRKKENHLVARPLDAERIGGDSEPGRQSP